MNRRIGLTLCALAGALTLSSCGSLDSDRVATVNGTNISTQEFEDYAKQQSGGALPQSGEETRRALTALIKSKIAPVPVSAEDARAMYEKALAGSPVFCLGAIFLADTAKVEDAKAAITAGTALAEVATQFGDATVQAQQAPNGVVVTQDGLECYPPSVLVGSPLEAALADAAIGEPIEYSANNVHTVLVLRPWDTLTAQSQQNVIDGVSSAATDAAASSANVSVRSTYGLWDAATGTVVAATGAVAAAS